MKVKLKSGSFNRVEEGNVKSYDAGDVMEVESLDDIPKSFHDMWEVLEEEKPKKAPAKKKPSRRRRKPKTEE